MDYDIAERDDPRMSTEGSTQSVPPKAGISTRGRGRSLPWPALETDQPQLQNGRQIQVGSDGFVTVEEWRAKPVTSNCLLTKPVTRNLTSASRAA
jgi:hypothetical protein